MRSSYKLPVLNKWIIFFLKKKRNGLTTKKKYNYLFKIFKINISNIIIYNGKSYFKINMLHLNKLSKQISIGHFIYTKKRCVYMRKKKKKKK